MSLDLFIECIYDKSVIINNLGRDIVDLEYIFIDGSHFRKKRNDLQISIVKLINMNCKSYQLH